MIHLLSKSRLAAALLVSITIAGCDSTGTNDSSSSGQRRGDTMLAPVGGKTADRTSEYDQRFLTRIGQDSLGVVVISRLAAQQSTNPTVKSFAKRMANSHNDLNERLLKLGEPKGVEFAKKLSDDDQRDMTQLKNAKGSQFDKVYVESMVRAFSSIANNMHEATRKATDPDVREFADNKESLVREHNQAAKALAKDLAAK